MKILKTSLFKNIQWIVFSILYILPLVSYAQSGGGGQSYPDLKTNRKALEKFQNERFGMFIHWGPVTLRGTEIGWSRGREVSIEDYDQLYRFFNPVLFDAADWVATAKKAGMKYLIITSKHHDGFCLWDSKYTEYDMMSTPYGKDILKALSDECKKQGIQFGIYYSIADWHHPDNPVVYPSKNYAFHEETGFPDEVSRRSMERYVQYMKNQLKELIEKYDPEIIWFDGEWEWAWKHEMGMDLYSYLRGLNDDLLINNRVDKGREGMEGTTKGDQFAGDFATPEQQVGRFDNNYPWESCITIANQWAWKPNDVIKSVKESIHTLVRTVGGDGNLLYNVGPMMDGRIEKRQVNTLREMGEWLKVNGESIYGTRGGPYMPSDKMVSTRKANNIYLHLLEYPKEDINLPFPNGIEIKKSYFLENGLPVPVQQGEASLSIKLPKTLLNDIATVIVLELDRPASDIEVVSGKNF